MVEGVNAISGMSLRCTAAPSNEIQTPKATTLGLAGERLLPESRQLSNTSSNLALVHVSALTEDLAGQSNTKLQLTGPPCYEAVRLICVITVITVRA